MSYYRPEPFGHGLRAERLKSKAGRMQLRRKGATENDINTFNYYTKAHVDSRKSRINSPI